jgi:hypothetical protein
LLSIERAHPSFENFVRQCRVTTGRTLGQLVEERLVRAFRDIVRGQYLGGIRSVSANSGLFA